MYGGYFNSSIKSLAITLDQLFIIWCFPKEKIDIKFEKKRQAQDINFKFIAISILVVVIVVFGLGTTIKS